MVNTESSGNNGVIIEESAPINTEMSNATKDSNEDCTIHEDTTIINDLKIGYCIYGHGENRMLFICGGVGMYPIFFLCVLLFTLYYKNYAMMLLNFRKQEVNRCMKDAGFCIKLMEHLHMTPFSVVGWSEGSRTAIHVANQGKQYVKSMILLSAGSRVDYRGAGIFRGMRNTEQWLPDAMEAYLKFYSKEYVTKQWADLCDVVQHGCNRLQIQRHLGMRNTEQWLPDAMEAYLKFYSKEYVTKQWADLCDVVQQVYDLLGGRFPCDYVLPNLKLPVLVLTGGMDRFCADPKYFTTVLPNCK
uniref:AB hydrolase-1 domain-containing protein n=1 Tax=Ascaris lumbricoides TaxID=6252 RepID=A0A0M3ILW0_ASCLU